MSIFSIIILSLSIFSTISAQLQATESEALIELNIGNMEKKARSGEIIHFVNQKNGKIYETISNATGKAALLLPEGFTYDIKIAGLGEEEEYSTIEIPSATGKHKLSLELNYEPAHVYTLEDVQFDAIKTKEFVGLVNALSLNNQKILLILGEKTDSVYLASRNLKKVKVVTADSFNTYDVLNARKVLVTQTAVSRIEEILN